MGNKQKIVDNLINLLNDVTKKRDETSFSCKSLQIKTILKKLATLMMNRSVLIDFQLVRIKINLMS